MAKVVVMDHPLIQHKIGLIRKKETGTKDFRQTIGEIAMLICYEATRELKLEDVEIETPICKTVVKELKGKKMAIVPILRAGLGMVDGVLNLIPAAKIGHIGLYRDPETLNPVEYYCKLPADCAEREVFVVDPMLATGGSSVAAIKMLQLWPVCALRIRIHRWVPVLSVRIIRFSQWAIMVSRVAALMRNFRGQEKGNCWIPSIRLSHTVN